MDSKDLILVKDWLVPISAFITLITTANGIWLSLRQFRLKTKEEIRLSKAAELESDIKLLKHFTEVVSIAHARKDYRFSEKVIENLFQPEILKQLGIDNTNFQKIIDSSMIIVPIGFAEQETAISAIWALGKKYKFLTPVALQSLASLNLLKPEVVEPYFNDLKTQYKDEVLATLRKNS